MDGGPDESHEQGRVSRGDELRRRAEELALGDPAAPAVTLETAAVLVHELRVHQIELEMQNEELRRTQLELDRSRATYLELFDLAPVGYLTLSDTNVVRSANLAAAHLLGVERSALVGVTLTHFIAPADQDVYYRYHRALAAGGEPPAVELRLASGDERWVRLDGALVAIVGHDGASARVTLTDISAGKQAEVARARLAAIVDSSEDAILSKTLDGTIVTWNAGAARLYGYAAEEVIGKNVSLLAPPDAQEESAGLLERVRRGETVKHHEAVRQRKDGSTLLVSLSISPIKDAAGAVIGASTIARDVTDRVLAAKALATSEHHFRLLAENAADVVFRSSNEGVTQWVSPSVATRFGWLPEQLVGRPFAELVHPDDLAEVSGVQQDLLRGSAADVEVRVRARTGEYRWTAFSIHPIVDETGAVVGQAGGWTDVHQSHEARLALQQSEARYRAVTDTAADAIITADLQGTIQAWNRGAERMFGYPQAEAVGRPVTMITPERFAAAHPAVMERFREGGERRVAGRVIELEGRRRDGSEFPIELSMAEWEVEGEPSVTTIIRDVTERHEVLAALADSEARLRAIVEGASEGINVLDLRSGKYTFMSRRQVEMTGFTADEMNDLSAEEALERLHPDDRETSLEQQRQLAAGQDEFAATEYRWRVKSGEYCWFRDSRRVLRDADGTPYALVGVSIDITEQKRLEEGLRASEAMRTVSEGIAGVGSFSWDLATGQITWSPEMFHLFDITAEEFDGQAAAVIETRVHPDDRAMVVAATAEAAAAGRPVPLEFRVVWRDGQVRALASAATTSCDAEGRPVAIVGYYQDVTETRRAEDEIRRLNDDLEARVLQRTAQLETSNKELESFVYSASHDLRAPLRAIDGFCQMIAEDAAERLDESDKEHLQRVRSAAQRMALLIDQLMALSRDSRRDLLLTEVDVSAVAASVLRELCAGDPGRCVETVVQPGLHAHSDQTLLRDVLTNLLGNAWKFTGRHETARIEVGALDVDGERAFFVRDDGAGFDYAAARQLFGPFQRFHTPEQFPGDGIGLATVQRLIARHGGRVWAESAVERGATFYFTLP